MGSETSIRDVLTKFARAREIPPPTFEWETERNNEDGDDEDEIELWSIRVPVSLNLEALGEIKVDLNQGGSTTFLLNDQEYKFETGHSVENEAMRVLVRGEEEEVLPENDKDSDDDDDDNNQRSKKRKNNRRNEKLVLQYLNPSLTPFKKHLNIVQSIEQSDMTLAPGQDNASEPMVPVRHAYAPVPQRSGLKRRWMPLGAKVKNIPQCSTLTSKIDTKSSTRVNGVNNSADKETSNSNDSSPPTKRQRTLSTPKKSAATTPLKSSTPKASKKSSPAIKVENEQDQKNVAAAESPVSDNSDEEMIPSPEATTSAIKQETQSTKETKKLAKQAKKEAKKAAKKAKKAAKKEKKRKRESSG